MVERRFIVEVSIPNSKPKFEIVKESHGHLICPKCGSISDIEIEESFIKKSVSLSFQNFSLSIYKECC